MRVTLDLAAKQGVDGVTTQDMAQAMGVTQGAVFRHFPSYVMPPYVTTTDDMRHLVRALSAGLESAVIAP